MSNDESPPDRIIERLRKILRLKEQGRDGEAEAAENRLAHLLDKHDLTLDDVRDDGDERPVELHTWGYKNPRERKLLLQVIGANAEDGPYNIQNPETGARRWKLGAYCDEITAADISERYEFYRDLWAEEVEKMLSAFIQKHEIFPDTSSSSESSLSLDELEELRRRMSALSDDEFVPDERRLGHDALPSATTE